MTDPTFTPTARGTTPASRGFGAGIFAGVFFALVAVVAAAVTGDPAIQPFRLFASVLLGRAALETASAVNVVVVGSIVHLVLSGVFGAIYGVLVNRLPVTSRVATGTQAIAGALFGGALWLVNVQVIARFLYPWFLEGSQLMMLLSHALFYGVPLGLLYASAERRIVEQVEVDGASRL